MYQNHKILMYKECSLLSETEINNFLYNVMMSLNSASSAINISPKYECKNKKNNNRFEWTKENFKTYLRRNCSKINNKISGYSVSFFSDLNEDDSCSLVINISCTDKLLSVLDLQLSYNICSSFYDDDKCCEEITKVFISLVECFDPFYACVKNDKNITGKLLDEALLFPTQLHWLNFFSDRKYSNFPMYLHSLLSEKKLKNGRVICFGKYPIDVLDNLRVFQQKEIFQSMFVPRIK